VEKQVASHGKHDSSLVAFANMDGKSKNISSF
jgi:hypothetical protein